MNKISTTIEQSQKLIELGVDINTADMYWLNRHIDLTETKYEVFVIDRSNEHIDFFNSYAVAVEKGEIIPAWSLSALLGLIPNSINFGYYNDSTFVLRKIENGNYIADYYEVSFVKDNPLDAAFEMICWLKENGKL